MVFFLKFSKKNPVKLLRQEQMDTMKNNEERLKKQVRELTTENKKNSADLKVSQEAVTELNRQLANYEKDKQCLVVSVFSVTMCIVENQKYT